MVDRFEAYVSDFSHTARVVSSFVEMWRDAEAAAATFKAELDVEWSGQANGEFDSLFALWSENANLIGDSGADLATLISTAETNYAEAARANTAIWTGGEPDRISVTPALFTDAADVFRTQATRVETTFTDAVSTLSKYGSMAGDDAGGVDWGQAYDSSADRVAESFGVLKDQLLSFGDLLQLSGENHANAELASRLTGTPNDPLALAKRSETSLSGPASALGGVATEPEGWEWVRQQCGLMWPNADTDKLKKAGTEWWELGASVDRIASSLDEAISDLNANWSAESAGIRSAWAEVRQIFHDVRTGCVDMSEACSGYAAGVEEAHTELVNTVLLTVVAELATQAAGNALAVPTAGLSKVAAAGLSAAELALAAGRATTIVSKLWTTARSLAAELYLILAAVRLWRMGSTGFRLGVTSGKTGLFTARLSPVATSRMSDAGRILLDVTIGPRTGFFAKTEAEKRAMYDAYCKRKIAAGLVPRSYESWLAKVEQMAANSIKGARFEADQAKDLNITPGTKGWAEKGKRVTVPGGGTRIPDLVNMEDGVMYEFKSGKGGEAAFKQLTKDEKFAEAGWTVIWRVTKDLEPKLLAELQSLAAKYPGKFKYEIVS